MALLARRSAPFAAHKSPGRTSPYYDHLSSKLSNFNDVPPWQIELLNFIAIIPS